MTEHSHMKNFTNIRQLTFCAICIALGTVTSFIKIASLPFGGSITLLSMLFITLPGCFFGLRTGITAGIAYGILQFILEPYFYTPLQAVLDYPLAFGALGLGGLFFKRKYGLQCGYIIGVMGRYLIHVISGYVFFAANVPEHINPLIYTLGYNLTYILPEMIVTVCILAIPAINKPILRAIRQVQE